MVDWNYDSVNKRIYPTDTANDDLIVGAASTEYVSGTELKMFFDKSKAAFRAGGFSNTNSDDASRGTYSVALGYNNYATNLGAVSLGYQTQATGQYSFAANEGSRATADYSSSFGGGLASGTGSFNAGTAGCVASGSYSTTFGASNTASATASLAHGNGATASRLTQYAHGTGSGTAQFNRFVSGLTTTNATPTLAVFNTGAAVLTGVTTNVLTMIVSKAHKFTVQVIARSTTSDVMASWEIKGSIVRYSSGNARFISTPTVTADKEASASAWDFTATINTSDATNNYLALTATGAASTTIVWGIVLETVEAI